MKFILLTLLFFATASLFAEGFTIQLSSDDMDKTLAPRKVEETLRGKLEWQLKTDTVKFTSVGNLTRLIDSDGRTIVEVFQPEGIHQVSSSANKKFLLLQLMRDRGGHAYDYTRLIRVGISDRGDWQVDTLLPKDKPPMNILHRWVSKLRSISNDGKTAELQIGEGNSESTPYKMTYTWERWDLLRGKHIEKAEQDAPANP